MAKPSSEGKVSSSLRRDWIKYASFYLLPGRTSTIMVENVRPKWTRLPARELGWLSVGADDIDSPVEVSTLVAHEAMLTYLSDVEWDTCRKHALLCDLRSLLGLFEVELLSSSTTHTYS